MPRVSVKYVSANLGFTYLLASHSISEIHTGMIIYSQLRLFLVFHIGLIIFAFVLNTTEQKRSITPRLSERCQVNSCKTVNTRDVSLPSFKLPDVSANYETPGSAGRGASYLPLCSRSCQMKVVWERSPWRPQASSHTALEQNLRSHKHIKGASVPWSLGRTAQLTTLGFIMLYQPSSFL